MHDLVHRHVGKPVRNVALLAANFLLGFLFLYGCDLYGICENMNRGKHNEEQGAIFVLGIDANVVNASCASQCRIGIIGISGSKSTR